MFRRLYSRSSLNGSDMHTPALCRASGMVRRSTKLRDTTLTEFASSETTVRRFLEEHRFWIGSKLGCRMEQAVLFELDFSMVQVAASFLLAGVCLRSDALGATRELQKLLESVELPPDGYPAFQLHVAREQRGRITKRRMVLEAEWQDGPAALWLRGFPGPVVAARVPVVGASRERDATCECVLVR